MACGAPMHFSPSTRPTSMPCNMATRNIQINAVFSRKGEESMLEQIKPGHVRTIRVVCGALVFISSLLRVQSQDITNLQIPTDASVTVPGPSLLAARGEAEVWVK